MKTINQLLSLTKFYNSAKTSIFSFLFLSLALLLTGCGAPVTKIPAYNRSDVKQEEKVQFKMLDELNKSK